MIDSRAVVHPDARVANDVQIGPFAVIGAHVEIDSGSNIHAHAVIKGPTKIGRNNIIFQFASVGEDCQDMKYAGESTQLVIGDGNIIREGATIHRGTIQDTGVTRIGNNNMIMAYVHIAHDCVIGDECVFANNATLGGHVKVGNYVLLGGHAAAHQFCSLGPYSMLAGGTMVTKDVPAYVLVAGHPPRARGMNFEGLRRKGWSRETISVLRKAYRIIYREGYLVREAVVKLEILAKDYPELKVLVASLQHSKRGIIF